MWLAVADVAESLAKQLWRSLAEGPKVPLLKVVEGGERTRDLLSQAVQAAKQGEAALKYYFISRLDKVLVPRLLEVAKDRYR